MKIRDVIETILGEIPGRREDTVDTLKSGDPAADVTGVVTTFIATRPVLERARQVGANLIISHEPVYYNHLDATGFLEGDPVFEAKRRYLEENGLAVWRFHDHWHLHRPDGIATGFGRKVGWGEYRDAEDASLFHIPGTTSLQEICSQLKERLGIAALRVAGDPEMRCSTLKICPGAPGEGPQLEALRNEGIDVVISGESPEWVACEYVRDGAFMGIKKGLIVLGHCHSEEAGMEYLAEWLAPKLGGVPVTFVAAGDPFRHV